MSIPNSREELIKWCLRKLGAPIIQINVDDDQIEDRIDESLLYFRDYHFDGIEKIYFKHQITCSKLVLSSAALGTFSKNDIIIGGTSGAQAYVYSKASDNLSINFKTISGVFSLGEIVTNQTNNETATISSSPGSITIGDVDNEYISLPERIVSVTKVLPLRGSTADYAAGGGMFDPEYQYALNNMYNFMSTDLISYTMYKQNLNLWNFLFKEIKHIRFNRKTDKIYLDEFDYIPGQYIVLEAFTALDPEIYTKIYSDEFVREYSYALLKRQWGENLKKFGGIQLPGGAILNGKEIYEEAITDIEKIQERLRTQFQAPPHILFG